MQHYFSAVSLHRSDARPLWAAPPHPKARLVDWRIDETACSSTHTTIILHWELSFGG